MQHPRRRTRRPHRQLDLALTSGSPTPTAPPVWGVLPEPTQRTLTDLLTRLLVAHAGGVAPEQGVRAGGDADER
jgi:hypothetical protein